MKNETTFEVALVTDGRYYTRAYHDFLDTELISGKEKIVFLLLKRYLDVKKDNGEVYPTLKTLSKKCSMSEKTIRTIIQQLEKKGILKIEQRGFNRPNLYTLYDYKGIWKSSNSQEVISAIETQKEIDAIKLLKSYGYTRIEKEPVSEPVKAHTQAPELNQFDMVNTTIKNGQSQDTKAFTRQMLNEIFDLAIMIENNKANESLFDAILELILELLNSSSPTIRVNKEDKPAEIVKSRLLKLNYMHIQYVADKVTEQSNIKDIRSYLITSLYNSYTTIDIHYSTMINKNNM